MKEPDKKYPLSVVGDLLASTAPSEVVFMPDKIYFDGVDTSTTPRLAINEIYIRKDYLLKFVNNKLQESADRLDFHANQAYSEVFDKLNEL